MQTHRSIKLWSITPLPFCYNRYRIQSITWQGVNVQTYVEDTIGDEIIIAIVKKGYTKVTPLDKIKAKVFNALLPKQVFIGNRKEYDKFKYEHRYTK